MDEIENEINEAIAIVDKSRQTHVEWSKFFEVCPEHQETVKDTVHSRVEQEEIIKEYTMVLGVLNKAKRYIVDDLACTNCEWMGNSWKKVYGGNCPNCGENIEYCK